MAHSQFSVSARSSNFLHVTLNTLWHVEMNDTLNITFVNTHGKGYSAYNDFYFIIDELPLNNLSFLVCFTCVVRSRSDAILIEMSGNIIGRLFVGAINDD